MKRAVWLLVAIGVVGLAQNYENPLERTSQFTIPKSAVMWAEGDLNFPSGSEVAQPGSTGPFTTNVLTIYGNTNTAISVTGEAWAFKTTDPCTKILPTQLVGVAYKKVGNNWVVYIPQAAYWVEANPPVTGYRTSTQFLPNCYGGYYKGEMWLVVYRDGYNDPAGTYVATVKIKVTVL